MQMQDKNGAWIASQGAMSKALRGESFMFARTSCSRKLEERVLSARIHFTEGIILFLNEYKTTPLKNETNAFSKKKTLRGTREGTKRTREVAERLVCECVRERVRAWLRAPPSSRP